MVDAASLVILFGLIWLGVSIWVVHDASKNSPHSDLLWGLAVFVGGFLGILLYFLLGRVYANSDRTNGESRTQQGLVECPNCHAIEDVERDVCRLCGEPISAT